MEIAYTQQETVGITELTKSLGTYIDKLVAYPLNKLAIIRRNKMEAVIIPIAQYEHMKKATDYIEDMAIFEKTKERLSSEEFEGGFDFQEYHQKRISKRDNVSN
ncbi:MAG: hypothetical protein U9N33_01315 [Campylobacterota bacterium]|nr:hypothetical protein [Campylobacterota bacterium]